MTWRVLKKLFGGWGGGIHTVFILVWISTAFIDSPHAQDAFEALFFFVLLIGCGRAIVAAFYGARNDVRVETLETSVAASDGSEQAQPEFERKCPNCGSPRYPVRA